MDRAGQGPVRGGGGEEEIWREGSESERERARERFCGARGSGRGERERERERETKTNAKPTKYNEKGELYANKSKSKTTTNKQ